MFQIPERTLQSICIRSYHGSVWVGQSATLFMAWLNAGGNEKETKWQKLLKVSYLSGAVKPGEIELNRVHVKCNPASSCIISTFLSISIFFAKLAFQSSSFPCST